MQFSWAKLKLLSFSAQLECNGWQILPQCAVEVHFFHSFLSSCWRAELQRLARASCTSVTGSNPGHWPISCKHKFETMQGGSLYILLVRIVQFAGWTRICTAIVLHSIADGKCQCWWEWMWYLISIFMKWHAVQNFETNQQYCAVLKQIRSLMLIFCRNYPAVVKYSAIQHVVCMQSKQGPGTSFFLAKQSIFHIINLHGICL